jgi:uncharacterized protein
MKPQKSSFSFDLRYVSAVLLIVIFAMLLMWRPWSSGSSARTINVTGESSMKVEPDNYQFSPMYEKKGTDRAAIQAELAAQVNGVIAGLKALGVQDSDITLMSSSYDNFYNDGTNEINNNSLTVVVENKDLVQNVQDYLLSTAPLGSVSPYATLSTKKRKVVEAELRTESLKDAKAKAQSTADELGLKVGKVVSISDPQSGSYMPYMSGEKGLGYASSINASVSLPVLSGKQEVPYSIQVTYELR